MRTFRIFEKDGAESIAIKKGVSWPAFFFVGFWSLVKGLWGFTLLYVAVCLFNVWIAAGGGEVLAGLLGIGLAGLFAIKGNEWLEQRALKNGYVFAEEVEAGSRESALQEHWASRQGGLRSARAAAR